MKKIKKIKLGTGFTVFLIFFGVSVIEAFRNKVLAEVVLWFFLGVLFLVADNMDQKIGDSEKN